MCLCVCLSRPEKVIENTQKRINLKLCCICSYVIINTEKNEQYSSIWKTCSDEAMKFIIFNKEMKFSQLKNNQMVRARKEVQSVKLAMQT